MALFVDTSVWSLAFRRDGDMNCPEVVRLRQALNNGELLVTTGLIVQELLQGFSGPRQRDIILSHFSAIPLIWPSLLDHVAAADLRNLCRRKGIQCGTIDALIAQLCIRIDVDILTSDKDFNHIARHTPLKVWSV